MQSVAYPVLSCPLKNLLNFPIYNSSEVPFVVQDTNYPLLKTIPVLRNRKANRIQSGVVSF